MKSELPENITNWWLADNFSTRELLYTNVGTTRDFIGSCCVRDGLVREAFDHNKGFFGYIITEKGWNRLKSLFNSNREWDEIAKIIDPQLGNEGLKEKERMMEEKRLLLVPIGEISQQERIRLEKKGFIVAEVNGPEDCILFSSDMLKSELPINTPSADSQDESS